MDDFWKEGQSLMDQVNAGLKGSWSASLDLTYKSQDLELLGVGGKKGAKMGTMGQRPVHPGSEAAPM